MTSVFFQQFQRRQTEGFSVCGARHFETARGRLASRRTSTTVDVLALRHPLQWDGDDGGAMAKKDAVSKRLSEVTARINARFIMQPPFWVVTLLPVAGNDTASKRLADEIARINVRVRYPINLQPAFWAVTINLLPAFWVVMAGNNTASKRLADEIVRARTYDNLGRAFHDLVLRLEYGYGTHDTDQRALLTVARFLEQMGPGLARFADQFARLAQTLQDRAEGRGVASRSDPTLVWVPRAAVALAVERLRRRGYTRREAAERIAEHLPELQQLITEKTAHDAKRSQSLVTAIISWSRDFGRRDSDVKIKNDVAIKVYSRGLEALEAAPDCATIIKYMGLCARS